MRPGTSKRPPFWVAPLVREPCAFAIARPTPIARRLLAVAARLCRSDAEWLVDQLITWLDEIDGDPDLELNGDQESDDAGQYALTTARHAAGGRGERGSAREAEGPFDHAAMTFPGQ